MRINDDLTVRAAVHSADMPWVPSPTAGVDRRMLFRIGEEKARATSIVRYARDSAFPSHVHGGGEEFLVLEGTFQDEHGDYPAGSYIRNPPGSAHSPGAADGCTIFVRLWQFRADDEQHVVRLPGEGEAAEPRPGASAARILFDDGHEQVRIEEWQTGAAVAVANVKGLELLVLSGGFKESGESFAAGSWLRLPPGNALRATTGSDGARVWFKAGPLLSPAVCAF
jgi:ChrR Cupin-like domain